MHVASSSQAGVQSINPAGYVPDASVAAQQPSTHPGGGYGASPPAFGKGKSKGQGQQPYVPAPPVNNPRPTANSGTDSSRPKRLVYPFITPEQKAAIWKANAEGRSTEGIWKKWATAHHDQPGGHNQPAQNNVGNHRPRIIELDSDGEEIIPQGRGWEHNGRYQH